MNSVKGTAVPVGGSADPIWWALAAALSLGSAWVPKVLHMEGDQLTQALVVGCALFFSGALVGCIRPVRPWRWGLACFAAFAIRDLAVLVTATGWRGARVADLAIFLLGNLGVYFLYALPVLVGAIIGGTMMRAGL
jgi:hypothetical protein